VSDQTTDGECDYFHLPPVLDEFVDKSNNKNPSAASSTRPNIDSESSAFGSDSDDQKSFKSRIPTTPPIQQQQRVASKPSTPVETIIIKEGEDDDKVEDKLPSLERQPVAPSETIKKDEQMMTSSIVREKTMATLTIIDNNASGISLQPTTVNIETELQQKSELKTTSNEQQLKVVENRVENEKVSKTSAVKASSDSINTISSAAQDELPQPQQIQQHQGHRHNNNNNITTPTTAGRTRSNSRKLGPPLLVRSQTARNLSTHLNNGNNQQTNTTTAVGGLNTQNPSTGNNNQRKELKKETDKDRETGERKVFLVFFV